VEAAEVDGTFYIIPQPQNADIAPLKKKPRFLDFLTSFVRLCKPVSIRPMKNSAVTAKEDRERSPEEKGIRAKKMPRKKVTDAMNRCGFLLISVSLRKSIRESSSRRRRENVGLRSNEAFSLASKQ